MIGVKLLVRPICTYDFIRNTVISAVVAVCVGFTNDRGTVRKPLQHRVPSFSLGQLHLVALRQHLVAGLPARLPGGRTPRPIRRL